MTLWIVAHQAPCLRDSPGNIYFILSINSVGLLSLVAEAVKNPPAVQETWGDPWVGKIPWRRVWQPTPQFIPGESPWTEEPGRLQSMGLQSQIQLSAQHNTSIVSICHICQSQCPNSSHSSFPLLVSMWCSLGWCLYFCFAVSSSLPFFLDSTYKWCYTIFVFLFLIYFILHNNPISNPKDDAVKVLHAICQKIWKTQQWPQDWKRSVIIPIPKKDNAKNAQTTTQLHSSH